MKRPSPPKAVNFEGTGNLWTVGVEAVFDDVANRRADGRVPGPLENRPELQVVSMAGGETHPVEVSGVLKIGSDRWVSSRGLASLSAAASKSASFRLSARPMKCGRSAATDVDEVTAQKVPLSVAEAAIR